MKIKKIIPLLAATALLTGCNLFKSSESFKPSKYSKEATCAEINEKYQNGLTEAGVPTTSDPVDFSLKGAMQYVVKGSIKKDSQTRESSSIKQVVNFSGEYDKDSKVAHTNLSAEMTYKASVGYGSMKYDMKGSDKNESYAQEVVKDDAFELTIAHLSEGRYSKETVATESLYAAFFNKVMSSSGFTMGSLIDAASYEAMSQEMKDQYKFYVDDNQFTMIRSDDSESATETKEQKSTTTNTIQYKVKENQLTYLIDMTTVSETKYLQNSGDYLAGEIVNQEVQMSYKGTFSFAEVNVKMKDLSKLSLSSEAFTVNSMFSIDLGL